MNRKETIELLKTLNACYPQAKISDPATTATTWEMILGEYPAEDVYKAARLYMSNDTKFYPSPGTIKANIPRAKLVYPSNELRLEAPKISKEESDYLDALCKFVGLGYEKPDDHALDAYAGFMDWEI